MKEKEVRELTIRLLEKDGWVCWTPPSTRSFTKERDIFGVFDLIAMRCRETRLIQYTTKTNLSHRRKKIQAFFSENAIITKSAYVYAYDKEKKRFIIERIKCLYNEVEL